MTAVAQNLRSMEVAKSKFLFNSDYNPVYLFPITASSLLLTSYHLFFAYLFILYHIVTSRKARNLLVWCTAPVLIPDTQLMISKRLLNE